MIRVLFAIALISTSGFAKVVEVTKMAAIKEAVQPGTVLVFDIDNTLVEASQMYGSDQWFEYLVNTGIAEGKKLGLSESEVKRRAVKHAIEIWQPVQEVTSVQLVEKATASIIEGFQKQGYCTMGLTARPLDIEEATQRHLRSAGVNLAAGCKMPEQIKGFEGKQDVGWYNGVLFVGPGNDKGESLIHFLKANGIEAKRVVFVDDKARNTDSVERACTKAGVDCVNFRYGAADRRVEKFDPRIAEVQGQLFGKILSDDEAARVSRK
jgi:phosphoglycolate phosphatase-like HAD superfamily hydrolase